MTQKRKPGRSRMSRRISHSASHTRPGASVTPLMACRSLRTAKAAREWIGLSLSEMADEVRRLVGERLAGAVNKQKIDRWEKTNRMPPKVRFAYGTLLANELTDQLGRDVGVSIKANSPWRITAWGWCACGAAVELRRADRKRCPKCIEKRG